MPENIIPQSEKPFVDTVARLINCNPFLDERIALEKEALGKDYQDTGSAWNVNPEQYENDPNLHALLKRIEQVTEKCRETLARKKVSAHRDLKLYRDLVYFLIYYRFRHDFPQYIQRVHNADTSQERVRFYVRFVSEADYFFKPGSVSVKLDFNYDHLFAFSYQVRRAFIHIFQYIIGTSSAVTRLRAQVWQSIFTHDMARYQRSLYNRMGDNITLITGPSGSGKELVAQAIGLSRFIPFDEKSKQFVEDFRQAYYPLNLSALSPTLIESELFGHCKGAFTGAFQYRKGYLDVCGPYGTIFLDEIGDVDPAIQVKLLRVLQTRQFQHLGETKQNQFSGKILAATNRNLVVEMENGRFREDFYYRLCADRIETPALKDILADSPNEYHYLVRYISEKVAGEEEAEGLTKEVCAWIEKKLSRDYSWPGNFRELEQCVRNILIHREYYPQNKITEGARDNEDLAAQLEAGDLTAEELIQQYATRIYGRTQNYGETARRLDVDWRTVKKYVNPRLLAKFSEK